MTTLHFEYLSKQIEQVVHEHVAASRQAAVDAIARAFASAGTGPRRAENRSRTGDARRRRPGAEIAALGDRLCQAVRAKPGETMSVLATHLGASPHELHLPMTHLKAAGQVRAVGERHLTRYFPIADKAAKSA